jgi:hypothetical protein
MGWSRSLRWYLLGKDDIPLGARVNPELFDEDEFPVYCPRCGALLWRLLNNCCGGCGLKVDRGWLLVEQYLRNSSEKRLSPRVRLIGFVVSITLVLSAIPFMLLAPRGSFLDSLALWLVICGVGLDAVMRLAEVARRTTSSKFIRRCRIRRALLKDR